MFIHFPWHVVASGFQMLSGSVVYLAIYVNNISSWFSNRVWSVEDNTWLPNFFDGISNIHWFHIIQNSFVCTGFPVIGFSLSLLPFIILILMILIVRMS